MVGIKWPSKQKKDKKIKGFKIVQLFPQFSDVLGVSSELKTARVI